MNIHVGKFVLGQVVATPVALEMLEHSGRAPIEFINRHVSGDWGDLGREDKQENELSIREGFRILSSYDVDGDKLWIITEADRSATTLLLPDEY